MNERIRRHLDNFASLYQHPLNFKPCLESENKSRIKNEDTAEKTRRHRLRLAKQKLKAETKAHEKEIEEQFRKRSPATEDQQQAAEPEDANPPA